MGWHPRHTGGAGSPLGGHRTVLTILGREWPLWALLYADDWDLTAVGLAFRHSVLAFALLLVAFGVPLSWKKSKGGFKYSWVGYEKCLRSWTLGISESRAAWLCGWFREVFAAGSVGTRELREAIGRMVFVYGALSWDRPFLAPLCLDESIAPWAFSRGLPARSISTLELLATTVGLVLMTPLGLEEPGADGTVTVQGLTDSQVSSHMVTKGLTTT